MVRRLKISHVRSIHSSLVYSPPPPPPPGDTIYDRWQIPAIPEWSEQEPPELPDPWSSEVPGFYYVDPQEVGATDTARTYGRPGASRLTIPNPDNVPAGSVIVLKGTHSNYSGGSSGIRLGGTGTAKQPVFVVGDYEGTPAKFTRTVRPIGTYVIVDDINIDLDGTSAEEPCLSLINGLRRWCFRGCEMQNIFTDGSGNTSAVSIGSFNSTWTGEIVIKNCEIHDNGDWMAESDSVDIHGIGIGTYAEDIWIDGCEFYHNQGNGVQVTGPNETVALQAFTPRRIHVVNCEGYENAQPGFWSKHSIDVTFAGCESHDTREDSPGSPEVSAIGSQYGPINLRVVECEMYNCKVGYRQQTASSFTDGQGQGNMIASCHIHDIGVGEDPPDQVEDPGFGISIRNAVGTVKMQNNRFVDCAVGIGLTSGSVGLLASGNTFTDMTTGFSYGFGDTSVRDASDYEPGAAVTVF